MNHDHADALRTIVDAFLDVDGEVIEARMLSCHRYGFEVQLALAPDQPDAVGGLAFGRLGFEPPLTAAKQARQAMGDLVSAARRIRT